MNRLPRLCLLDRDGSICYASPNPTSPFYYLKDPSQVVLRPGVKEAVQIIAAHGVPMWLVTKQRGISKGLVTREQVDAVNRRVEELLGMSFARILVEPEAPNKLALYKQVLEAHAHRTPESIHLFDDSRDERRVARDMGICAWDGSFLLESVCEDFEVR